MNDTAAKRGFVSKLFGLVIKVTALLVVVTAMAWIATRPSRPDAFYDHMLPQDAALGTLLKSEPFTRDVPEGAKG